MPCPSAGMPAASRNSWGSGRRRRWSESRQACSYSRARRTAVGEDASSHVRRPADDTLITGSPTPSPFAVAVLEDALNGPLADPEPLADVLAREALGLQLQDRPPLDGHQLAKSDEDLVGLGHLAG